MTTTVPLADDLGVLGLSLDPDVAGARWTLQLSSNEWWTVSRWDELRHRTSSGGKKTSAEALAVAPWNDAGWHEHRAVLHEEINRLPRNDRAAIILCDLEGRSPGDVARELRCSVGRLEQRLATARARLQARMLARGFTIPGGCGVTELSRDAESMVSEHLVESTVEAVIRRQSRPEQQATVRDDHTEPGARESQTPDRGGSPGPHPRGAAEAPLPI